MNALLILLVSLMVPSMVGSPARYISTAPLTRDEVRAYNKLVSQDHALFCKGVIRIATKEEDGLVKPMLLTPNQHRCVSIQSRLEEHCGYAHIIDLKARQVKHTTLWESIAFRKYLYAKGPRKTMLIGDQGKTTGMMVNMWRNFYAFMPSIMRPELALRGQEFSRDMKLRRNGAMILAETAERVRAGQGNTIHSIVASEVPYFSYPEVFTAAFGTIPKGRNMRGTFVVLEGTANGQDATFYPRYVSAKEHARALCDKYGAVDQYDLLFNISGWGNKPDFNGVLHPRGYWDGSFFPIFTGWYEEPEYVRNPAEEEIHSVEDLTAEERKEMVRYADTFGVLTLEQMAFRRYTIRNECDGDVRRFRQEYPANDVEAFLVSGDKVFDTEITADMLAKSEAFEKKISVVTGKPGIQRIWLDWKRSKRIAHSPQFEPTGRRCINMSDLQVSSFLAPPHNILRYKVRSHLDYTNVFCMGVDIATGIAMGKGDYSVGLVKNRVTQEYVCLAREQQMEEDDFAYLVAKIGYYYGGAFVLAEFGGGHGSLFLKTLSKIYPSHLIMRGPTYKHGRQEIGEKVGAVPTIHSKGTAVESLKRYIRRYPMLMPFYQPWREASTYVKNGVKMEAAGKSANPGIDNHDDCVAAWYWCETADEMAPPPVRSIIERDEDGETIDRTIRLVPEGMPR